QDGTRAAFALAASFFYARQSQVVSQHVQQSFHGMGEQLLCAAVDGERKLVLRACHRQGTHTAPRAVGETTCWLDSGRRASKRSSGSSGMEQKQTPVASSTALTIAGAGPSIGSSPMPFAPCAPCTFPISSKKTRIRGRSAEVGMM